MTSDIADKTLSGMLSFVFLTVKINLQYLLLLD